MYEVKKKSSHSAYKWPPKTLLCERVKLCLKHRLHPFHLQHILPCYYATIDFIKLNLHSTMCTDVVIYRPCCKYIIAKLRISFRPWMKLVLGTKSFSSMRLYKIQKQFDNSLHIFVKIYIKLWVYIKIYGNVWSVNQLQQS